MSVNFIGDSYEFDSANREENYGGDINLYIVWDQHLMYACPSAYRAPKAIKMRDFLEQMFKPDYSQHPDIDKVDWDKAVWEFCDQPGSQTSKRALRKITWGIRASCGSKRLVWKGCTVLAINLVDRA